MGTLQTNARKASKKARSPMGREDKTVNRAGGVAFDIKDSSEKLLTMVGARLDMSEPSYYSADKCVAVRGDGGTFERLKERLAIVDGKLEGFIDTEDFNDVAREVIATTVDVLNSDNPRDVLAIANWLRNDMHLRLTPAILMVLASMHAAGRVFVPEYGPKVVQRPDDIKNALLFWRYIRGTRLAPKSLRVGLAEGMSKFGEAALIKYDSDAFPTWKDVLRWLPRKKGYPVSAALREYFVNGVTDEKGTPIAYNRKALAQCEKLDDKAKKLIKKTRATWENVLSQFGRTQDGKRDCWEYLVKSGLVGYMAMLRNLRNMVEADVGAETFAKVAEKLGNPDEIRKSRQLPFRYLAAANEIDRYRSGGFKKSLDPVFSAVEEAVEVACENVPAMPGVTVVFADNSGSMNTGVSDKSKMTCRDAANMLAGIMARRGETVYVCGFSDDVTNFRVTKRTTALGLAQQIGRDSRPSCTNTHRCFDWMLQNKIVADRVVLLSDMQAWYGGGGGFWRSYNEDRNVANSWEKYKKFCGKKASPWLHSVHLNGYGDNPTPADDPRVNLISGFSENIVRMMLNTEQGVMVEEAKKTGEVVNVVRELPTIDQIRANW